MAKIGPALPATDSARIGKPLIALLLTVLTLCCLIPSGFRPESMYWALAEAIALCWLILRGNTGARVFPRLDSLRCLLVTVFAVCGLQLVAIGTESFFLTAAGLHFAAGSLALLALYREAWRSVQSYCDTEEMPILSSSRVRTLTILVAMISSGGLVAGLASLGYGWPETDSPGWWPFAYRNHAAALVVLLLPAFAWLGWTHVRYRVPMAIATVAGAGSVLATGSRAAAILLVLELIVLVAQAIRRRPRSWCTALLSAATVLVLALAVGGADILQFRLNKFGLSADGRLDYWISSVEMIQLKPLLGWNWGLWPDVYRQFQEVDMGLVVNHAHSDWLEWTSEGGVALGFALTVLFVQTCRTAWVSPSMFGSVAFLLMGMVDYNLRQPLLWAMFLLLHAGHESFATRNHDQSSSTCVAGA